MISLRWNNHHYINYLIWLQLNYGLFAVQRSYNIKKNLANGRLDNKVELTDILSEEICQIAASHTILRGGKKPSELTYFLP